VTYASASEIGFDVLRDRLGLRTAGPTRVITDLCLFEPDPETREMTVVSIHPGVTREQIQENTGWQVKFAAKVAVTPAPAAKEKTEETFGQ